MVAEMAELRRSRMARLRLLSWRCRLLLCAALAACLGIFALGELAIRSALRNGQGVNLLLAELALLALALLAITVLILLTRLAVERATLEYTITSRSARRGPTEGDSI